MKCEITISNYFHNGKKRYKVTRRFPDLAVSDTLFFSSKKKARQQFREWLLYHNSPGTLDSSNSTNSG